MSNNSGLKLFISYSHSDEKEIKDFIKHIAPLKNKGLIQEWYDRKIIAGKEIVDSIENNLKNANVICLFISANFLASPECIKEKSRAFEIRKEKGTPVICIVLSPCGWRDDANLFSLLALPTDGKPVSEFADSNVAWQNVYEELKNAVEGEIKILQMSINDQFMSFLKSTELFSKAHSQKKEVFLDDIFVFPELKKYDDLREFETKIDSKKLIDNFTDYTKILIAGEDQSGKTTLCKKMFLELRNRNFIPIYISDKTTQYKGIIDHRIEKAYKEQYESSISFGDLDKGRVVPIIDDFHFAKQKEKHIQDLTVYRYQVVIVDDIFSLNFEEENLIKSFNQFTMKQFCPSLRNCLIEKWVCLSDRASTDGENQRYQGIDKATELVNTTLGKVFSSGIMPAYPFFILSIISTYETFEKPLDQEITSQGYCYQALIYLYLRKQGVKNDQVDTYINFLTEFSFYFYKAEKQELPFNEFELFMKSYLEEFNLPIKQDVLIKNLRNTKIIFVDSLNNYSFHYEYLYYFFVAKYLAEHRKDNLKIISSIINNLHKNENAYISIFIAHHSKSNDILEEITLNAMCLFDKYQPATLTKNELKFFDDEIDNIVKAALPPENSSPEKIRGKRLADQDRIEQINEEKQKIADVDGDDPNDILARELRRSIKTVEVMGSIIKNRAGSLEKDKLENIFKEAMNVHLRILSSFFELIKQPEQQQQIIEFIKSRLMLIKDKPEKLNHSQLEKFSKKIFWGMNFSVVFGFINKIVHSIGSDKLQIIVDNVCSSNNTPASFLVKHGILMWHSKNLQIDNIVSRIKDDGFSGTAERVLKFMIVNHCSLHQIGFKEKQKIENKLGIPATKLLTEKGIVPK